MNRFAGAVVAAVVVAGSAQGVVAVASSGGSSPDERGEPYGQRLSGWISCVKAGSDEPGAVSRRGATAGCGVRPHPPGHAYGWEKKPERAEDAPDARRPDTSEPQGPKAKKPDRQEPQGKKPKLRGPTAPRGEVPHPVPDRGRGPWHKPHPHAPAG